MVLLLSSFPSMKLAVIISPNWKDYAQKYLEDCLASLRLSDFQDFKIYLIDNETSNESFSYLKAKAPEAKIITLEKNEGFAGGNNAALKEVLENNFEYVFLLNMDALVSPNCLGELINCADSNLKIGALQPRIMLWPEKDLINSLGNETHFLGFGFCRAYREKYNDIDKSIKEVVYVSGAGMLLRTEALKEIGIFDEELWMYNEDQDLSLRLALAGWENCILPKAEMFHKYEFSRSINKYYWMDRNRIIVILKSYKIITLILILPAFIIMEIGHIFFSLAGGWFKEKLRVWFYFLKFSSWVYIFKARLDIQSKRKINDRLFTKNFVGKIWYQEIADWKLRLANPFFNIYWIVVRFIMFW